MEAALAHAERQRMDGGSTYKRIMSYGGVLKSPSGDANKPVEIFRELKRLLLEGLLESKAETTENGTEITFKPTE